MYMFSCSNVATINVPKVNPVNMDINQVSDVLNAHHKNIGFGRKLKDESSNKNS